MQIQIRSLTIKGQITLTMTDLPYAFQGAMVSV